MTYVSESSVLGVSITFIVLSCMVVPLRFAVRGWKKQVLAADDWLALAALPFVVAVCITMIIGSRQHTMGGHGHDPKLNESMQKVGSKCKISKLVLTVSRLSKQSALYEVCFPRALI